MKAKINGIEFEGTPEEFNQLLDAQKSTATQKSQPLQPTSLKVKKVVQTQLQNKEDVETTLPGTSEFITALFRYKPSKHRNRQGYVLQLLASGKTYTIRTLAARATTDTNSVISAIRRAVAAGCVIQVNNRSSVTPDDLNQDTKVRLLSLGTIERAVEVKKEFHVKNAQENKSKQTQNLISTGSAPITKILYNENN